jgi:hypothetical protein
MRWNEVIAEETLNGFTIQSLDSFVDQESDSDELNEADFGLGAHTKTLPDKEMSKYLDRIYKGEKTPTDKYKLPYIHKSNIKIVDDADQPYDLDALKEAIMQRPSSLLKQNEKMVHSSGTIQFYNVGLPALKGLVVNEKTGKFVIADTCPGSGSCKLLCYAMNGSYILFKAVSMKQTQTLNYLVNDPESFTEQLKAEIMVAIAKNRSKAKVAIRWHDSGDFFSPEYMKLAFDVARAFPKNLFYAYTKMASVANAEKPKNFIINFSSGSAAPAQEKLVDIENTKRAVIVPTSLFGDLMQKNGRTIIRDENGAWAFTNEAMNTLKDRIAQKYHIDRKTILSYEQYMKLDSEDKLDDNKKFFVIVRSGNGDNSSTDPRVQTTFLLQH